MPLRRMPLPFKILGSLSWAVPYGPSTLLHPARVRLVTSLQSPETSYFSLNSLCGTCGFLLAKTMLNLLKAYIVFLQLLPVLFVYDLRLPWWDGEAERGWGVTPQPCFRCRRSPCSVSPLWHLMKLKTLRGGPALMPTRLSLLQMKARSSAAAGRVSGWGEGRSFCTPRPLSPRCPLQAAARAARPPHPAPTWGEKRRRPSSAARRITLPAVKRRRARGRVVARRRSALGLGVGEAEEPPQVAAALEGPSPAGSGHLGLPLPCPSTPRLVANSFFFLFFWHNQTVFAVGGWSFLATGW